MVQLNLLPDVKLKYAKARKAQRTFVLSSVILSGIALVVVGLLAGVVYGTQKITLASLDKSIEKSKKELQSVEGLDKILTIQNQLQQLPGLHDDKPVMTRLFTYLPQITPADVRISELTVTQDGTTFVVAGEANSMESINRFIDTLKFTDYTIDSSSDTTKAFSEVVLSQFGKTEKGISYSINFKYNPDLFDSKNTTVTLVVPKITTTRSEIERPDSLFSEQSKKVEGQ